MNVGKPITTRMHGVIDYAYAAAAFALARRASTPSVRGLLAGFGAAALAMSAFTRYELGLVKVVPIEAHLVADLVVDPLLGVAALLADEDDGVTRATLAALAVAGLVVVALTETESRDRSALS